MNLLKTKGCNRFTDEYMLAYLENKERCGRQMLFSEMEGNHSSCESIQRLCLCCDICKKKCVCNSCTIIIVIKVLIILILIKLLLIDLS